jgi:hypothetical protein
MLIQETQTNPHKNEKSKSKKGNADENANMST